MAYYSGLKPEIYHVCKNCPDGKSIAARNLREGQPRQATLCDACTEMVSQGQCVLGIPTPTKKLSMK